MNEIVFVGLIFSISIVSVLFYVIFNVLYKNNKFRKIVEKDIELTRTEKGIDKSDAQQRRPRLMTRGNDKR